ncbi:MAG: MlaD family protein [Ignavibacteriales bacterium]|nr:MlaD family protein [Ignavibacteriales bacterium]
MKDQRKTEIKVGITVLLGLIALIYIFGWAKNYKVYANQKYIDVEFETASGLESGDPVMVNGVRSGFVDDILVKGNNVIVKVVVNPDVQLKEDAVFSISMLDLMGGKKIEVKPGLSSKTIDYTIIQKGKFEGDISTVMAMVGGVQNDLVKIIKDLQVTLSSVNNIISDKEFNSQIRSSISNLAQISSKLNVMIEENRTNLKTITNNTAELTKEATAFLNENKDQVKAAIDDVRIVIKSTNELVAKINNLTDETLNKKNNVGKLLYDDQLITDLKTSLEQVKELTKIILEQLKGKGLNVDANVDLF